MIRKTLYSIRETMEHLGGISRASMYLLINNGEIATLNIGRRRFVSDESLSAFIEKQTKKTELSDRETRKRLGGRLGNGNTRKLASPEKVLVIVADEQIRVYYTLGVETAVIVDGEDFELPDDWADLPLRVIHSMPITVRAEEMFEPPRVNPMESLRLYEGSMMKAPYCHDCDGNHPVKDGCDGPPRTCNTCGVAYGEKHKTSCLDQNVFAPGGDIFAPGGDIVR